MTSAVKELVLCMHCVLKPPIWCVKILVNILVWCVAHAMKLLHTLMTTGELTRCFEVLLSTSLSYISITTTAASKSSDPEKLEAEA